MDKQQEQDQDNSLAIKKVAVMVLISAAMLALFAVPVSAVGTWGFGTNGSAIDPYIIDYPNLSALIGNMAGVFPGIVTLVVGVLPILITLAIIGVIFGILGAVIGMINGLAHGLFK